MSLPVPDAFDYQGRSYSLEGSHGTGLPGWRDFGLPKHPGWSAYRQTYGLWEGRLVVGQIALHLPAGEAPPPIDGVTPRAGEGRGGRARAELPYAPTPARELLDLLERPAPRRAASSYRA